MSSNTSSPDAVAEMIRRHDWRVEMIGHDQEATERLLQAYQRNQRDIEAAMTRLIAVYRQQGGNLNQEEFRSLDEYQQFLAVVNAELSDFAVILRNQMSEGIETGVVAGLDGAERTVGLFIGQNPVVAGIWVRPDPEAVVNAIGFVDSAAFRDSLRRFGDRATNSIADVIIAAVAQGRNPNQIARIISDWTSVPFAWATNMTRTSQIYAARLATHSAYASNPNVVEGWMWLSAQDLRTCLSCWSQHGMIFDHDQTLNDHHRGRCTPAPLVRGRNWWRDYPRGRDTFETLSEADQRAVFRNHALYEAWQNDEVGWDDFSQPYQNPIYGEMLRVASLTSLRISR